MTRESKKEWISKFDEAELLLVFCEEMGELAQAISKYKRYGMTPDIKKNISKEMSDVSWCLELMETMFENSLDFNMNLLKQHLRIEKELNREEV